MTDELRPHPLGLGATPASAKPVSLAPSAPDLERRVAALEAKPKRVPPPPRKSLPWPRAAVRIAWIMSSTLIVLFLIMAFGLVYLADTLPLLNW